MKPFRNLPALLLCLLAPLFTPLAQANPDIAHWQTDNGARVYFVHTPELPMVDVRVVFDAGSARDNGHPGVAVFTNAMLAEGADGLDATTLAERFDNLGAQFSNEALRDMSVFSLRSLSDPEYLQPALANMATILAHPDFPERAVERTRNQLLVLLQSEAESPGDIASKAYMAAIYGDHPYASPSNGTLESVPAIDAATLHAFHQRYYVASNAVVAIVGNLSPEQARATAEQVVTELPAGEPAPALPAVVPLGEAVTIDITHTSSQTHILMGQPGLKRGDPDYFPLYVGNHMLGGSGLVSRISEEIREKRGLAYSAYSYFSPMRLEGPFMLGLQTRNDATEEALGVLRDTLTRFVAEGPSAEELEASKRNITGGFALRIDSNSDIVGYLAMIGFYDLPLDYLDTFNQRVEAVTLEDIKAAFRRRIDPARMVTVTVGGGA